MNLLSLTTEQLKQAINLKTTIEKLQNKLTKLMGGEVSPGKTSKRKRKMSKAGRAKIVAAQKARWKKQKGAATPAAKKGRRKMSPAARAKIAAAAKLRWKKAKAAGKKRL